MPGKDSPDANQVDDLLRSLTKYTADMIAILEADGTIRYVNPVVERVLGYRADELVGKNALDYMHPDDEGRVSWTLVERQNNSGINPPLEFRVRYADRSWRHVEMMSNNLLHDPKVRGIVASVRDVSERKRAEERVRFQAQLLEAVGQAIAATDLPGNVTYWGPGAQGLYGWLAEEVVGRPLREILVPENQQHKADEIVAELRAGRNWSGEFLVRRRGGTAFPAMVTDTPVRDEQGNLVGIIGVSTDLTELKEAEKALRASEKLAQRQLAELQTI